MARNTSVSLGEHFTTFIEEQVASGRYASASDVIRDGLRRLEDDQQKLDTLRALIEEGMEDVRQGRLIDMTPDFWERIDREVDEQLARAQDSETGILR